MDTEIAILTALRNTPRSEFIAGKDLQVLILQDKKGKQDQAKYEDALLALQQDGRIDCERSDAQGKLWYITPLGRKHLKEVLHDEGAYPHPERDSVNQRLVNLEAKVEKLQEELDTLKAQQDNHPSTH